MVNQLATAFDLYWQALRKTWHSLLRGWMTIVAVIAFLFVLIVAQQIAAPLGMAGGFLLGAVNALLVGMTLSLVEQSVSYAKAVTIRDVFDSFGQYFWDVIGVGFVLWIPLMALDMGTQQNPNGQLISYAVMLLIFILLNPAPEIIYQVPHDSPLDIFKRAYDFVLENWIEWFLPIAILLLPLVAAPGGLTSFFLLSHRVGRGAGLDFSQILIVPFTILASWLSSLGLAPDVAQYLILLLTPPLAVSILLFRGHLFASLSRSSHRQRQFASQLKGNE
ncbi:MAG TPA: hypothetical protein VL261_06395 [Nitrospira sp.]|jgi:hypothetical protein|nr:hypothetical protein [Nitrospira sp.]